MSGDREAFEASLDAALGEAWRRGATGCHPAKEAVLRAAVLAAYDQVAAQRGKPIAWLPAIGREFLEKVGAAMIFREKEHRDDATPIYAKPPVPPPPAEADSECHYCGAPTKKKVLPRSGEYGWGGDEERTVRRYIGAPHTDD